MKNVEKDSVIHLSLQLWNEPWPYGMENEETELRQNINVFLYTVISKNFQKKSDRCVTPSYSDKIQKHIW